MKVKLYVIERKQEQVQVETKNIWATIRNKPQQCLPRQRKLLSRLGLELEGDAYYKTFDNFVFFLLRMLKEIDCPLRQNIKSKYYLLLF